MRSGGMCMWVEVLWRLEVEDFFGDEVLGDWGILDMGIVYWGYSSVYV